MRVILHLIRKEFLQVMGDRAILGIIFIMPIVQLFVLGYAINTDVKNIALGICDADHTAESRAILDRFTHSARFRIVANTDRIRDMNDLIDRGEVSIILNIKKGFGELIQMGQRPEIQIIVDGVDSNSALIAAGYARNIIIGHFQSQYHLPVADIIRLRALYNPELESRFTIVPGIIAVLLTIVTMLLTALGLVREREIGTLEQLMVTPIRPIQLVIGKVMPFAFLGGAAFAVAVTTAMFHFKIPLNGSIWNLILFTGIYLLTTLGLGMFISTVTSTQQQAVFLAWFLLVASILMSGFMFPISNMPLFLQRATYLIPLRYYISAIREILLKGSSLSELQFQLTALTLFGVSIFSFSVLKFKKTM